MTHREVLEALSGLLLAMFVAMLSSTVVTNALPRIINDLEGSQTGYTWVVVATLLTMTATTPIWGKLADQFSKKLLVQSALVIYSIGSLVAGLAPSMGVLIGARAVQGLGVGGLTALVQVVIASMVPPRERGRYAGYIGATFALATVSGPLDRRRDRGRTRHGLALVLLPRHPGRPARVRGAPEDAAPAGRPPRGDHRLPRRHPARRRRLPAAGVGVAGRLVVRLGVPDQSRPGGRRPARGRRGDLRRGPRGPRARDPAAAVPRPHHVARHRARRCSSASRCSARRSTSASTSSSPAA